MKRRAVPAQGGSSSSTQKHGSEPCPAAPDSPAGPSCPCCPKDPQGCPIPGGCAMCSIAKAPCVAPVPSTESTLSPTLEMVCEFSFSYLSPLSDGLQRPPRARSAFSR
jgi:hypothetical protein